MSLGCLLGARPVKLTTTNIRALKLPPGATDKVFFDEGIPGFGLRMRARLCRAVDAGGEGAAAGGRGRQAGTLHEPRAGPPRRKVLGLLTALDPGKARATAKDLLAQVRLGRDPAGEKERARAAAAETF